MSNLTKLTSETEILIAVTSFVPFFSKQREELSRQLADIKTQLQKETFEREKAQRGADSLNDEIEKLKSQVADYERQIIIIRRHNDELDSQLKGGQAKTSTLENEISSNKKEIENLTELNTRLQKEKQEILKAKHDTEAEMQKLKEQIRKLEQELEKLRNENKALQSAEAKAKDGMAQQMHRAHFLQKELDDAKARIKELEEKLAQLEKAYKDKLRQASKRSRSSGGGKSTDTGTTSGDEADADPAGDGTKGDGGGAGGGTTTTTTDYEIHGYDPEIVEIKIKEVNDKWKLEVERLENEKSDLESRIRELEDQLLQAERINERHQNDVEDAKRKLQAEIDRLKDEIAKMHDKHQNELEEERESYKKVRDSGNQSAIVVLLQPWNSSFKIDGLKIIYLQYLLAKKSNPIAGSNFLSSLFL